MENEASRILEFLGLSERLKRELRHSWLSDGRRESVAEHTWQMALVALLAYRHLEHPVDIGRVLKIILVHDLEHIPQKASRRGFSRDANADSILATESGGWDGQAVQHGFTRAGSFGDRRRGIDASGGGAVCDRDCDGRDMGAAEAGNGGSSPCQTGQTEGIRA
jgi:hypothetical protein